MSISRLKLANKEAAGLSLALISRPSARRRETGRSGDVLRPDGSRYGPSQGRGTVVCQGEREGVLEGGGGAGRWVLAWLGVNTRKRLSCLQI